MNKSILDIKLQAAKHPLYKEVIETWLSDYKELWQKMLAETSGQITTEKIHGRTLCEFERIHMHLDELMDYYRIEVLCDTAILEYH